MKTGVLKLCEHGKAVPRALFRMVAMEGGGSFNGVEGRITWRISGSTLWPAGCTGPDRSCRCALSPAPAGRPDSDRTAVSKSTATLKQDKQLLYLSMLLTILPVTAIRCTDKFQKAVEQNDAKQHKLINCDNFCLTNAVFQ